MSSNIEDPFPSDLLQRANIDKCVPLLILHSWRDFSFLVNAVNLASLASAKFAIKAK